MQLPDGYTADSQAAFALMKTRPRLSIDDLKVLALLESAAEQFYFGLAQQMTNAEARALLTRNGQEELGHAHRLVKAIRLLGGETFELPRILFCRRPRRASPSPRIFSNYSRWVRQMGICSTTRGPMRSRMRKWRRSIGRTASRKRAMASG